MQKIKIMLHDGASMPERHGECYDLATAEEVEMKKGDVRIIPFGVSMELPRGEFGMVFPRSSTCLKHGIIAANSVGIIESAYCGNDDIWGFVAYAVRDARIPAGTRIAQFYVVPRMGEFEFERVDDMENESRGGYGSTGTTAGAQKVPPIIRGFFSNDAARRQIAELAKRVRAASESAADYCAYYGRLDEDGAARCYEDFGVKNDCPIADCPEDCGSLMLGDIARRLVEISEMIES